MNPIVINYLLKLEFGEPKVFDNMAVFPLFTSVEDNFQYLTLKEALEKRLLTITEVSQSGSVPELKVVSQAEIPVLLLDGEELAGAKQNRVLNTTILLREKSETIIPVSCTEQGRWAYALREFEASGYMMNRNVRARKLASVSYSLEETRTYRSNQGAVWEGVAYMARNADVGSPTGAMRDVFEAREKDLTGYLETFPCLPDQKGIFVMGNGRAVGFDVISRSQAYEQLHQKIVKSYAMDALLRREKRPETPSIGQARAFIEEAAGCEEKRYESIGYGWDYRFEGKTIVGSSLVYQDRVIHMAFFRADESERAGTIATSSRRRRFRM